jgi:hypothetical protein
MENIKLIIAADEPALFFTSVERAESYLEAIDVEDGVYTAAYGTNGEPYRISSKGNRVAIIPIEGEQPKVEELRSLLFNFLKGVKRPYSQEESLQILLQKCGSYITK